MNRFLAFFAFFAVICPSILANDPAIGALMERISPGLSRKIEVTIIPDSSSTHHYTISSDGTKPVITANHRTAAARALHQYLQDIGVQLTWDCMNPAIPDKLPLPSHTAEASTRQTLRYYLNYCTHSYSMAFWDLDRWQREIDWMALHGINAALAITGTDAVWDATLRKLGYPKEKIDSFIAAPAYQAWWLMNNLEGEGVNMTRSQLDRQAALQQQIITRMRQLDIEPVFPGYAGMVPHDAATTLGLTVQDPGMWCGYRRPAFLQPTDSAFARIASVYYSEQKRLFGTSIYYSMDPFHEGGNTAGVDLTAAAMAIEQAMAKASQRAVWLIQGWQENPRTEILEAITPGSLTVLDLHAESAPQWSHRGHMGHPWVWCMLLNFGGNTGMHGKIHHMAADFNRARTSPNPPSGAGLTMEGIENNPIMYELAMDLPWSKDSLDVDIWLKKYLTARYGQHSPKALDAWQILANSIYDAPPSNRQQGTTESPFVARPSDNPTNASAWANAEPYYSGADVIRAAELLLAAAPDLSENPHYIYDLVDCTRQAVAEAARAEARKFHAASLMSDSTSYRIAAGHFMDLLHMQDTLLGTLPHFRLGTWTSQARAAAATENLADGMERDSRRLITVWGSRQASERGHLHDYGNREWQGLLADFHAPRWEKWFDHRLANWGNDPLKIDFYTEIEAPWVDNLTIQYSPYPEGNPIEIAATAIELIKNNQQYISK